MKKRSDKRVKKRLMVSLNDNGFEELGITKDVSRAGMGLSSDIDFSPHTEIELSIAVPGDVFTLRGEVIWCRKSNDKDLDTPDDIGIKITEAPVEYLNYIEFVKHQKIKPGIPEF